MTLRSAAGDSGKHLRQMIEAFERRRGRRSIASTYAGVRGIPAIFPRAGFCWICSRFAATRERARCWRQVALPVIALPLEGGEIDIDRPEDLARAWVSSALDRGFDVAVRLVDGDEDVVGIVLSERAEIRRADGADWAW